VSRRLRNLSHNKQERMKVLDKTPIKDDMSEGVPVLAATSTGVEQYVKHNGVVYKQSFTKAVTRKSVSTFPSPDYDSGWVYITTNSTYELTHGLDLTIEPTLVQMFITNSATPIMGTNVIYDTHYTQHNAGTMLTFETATTLTLRTDNNAIIGEGGSGAGNPDGSELTAGYAKIRFWV